MTRINQFGVSLAAIALLFMTILGAADVIGSGMGTPIAGAYELIETLMVITIFLSISAAQQHGTHINVELVKKMLGPRAQATLALFGLLCSGLLFLLIAYYGWFATLRSFGSGEIRQGQLGFPVWPARMALALGASLMVLQCLAQFVGLFRDLMAGRVTTDQITAPDEIQHH